MSIDHLYLISTYECANGCDFCYIPSEKRSSNKMMEYEQARDLIDELKPAVITVSGGEPLYNLSFIRDLAKRYSAEKFIRIETSAKKTDLFKGLVHINSDYRFYSVDVSGDGLNETVLENSEMALQKNTTIGYKAIITESNIDQIEKICENLSKLDNLGADVDIAIVRRTHYDNEFLNKLQSALEYAIKALNDIHVAMIDHMMSAYLYTDASVEFRSCKAGTILVVDPNGKRSFCPALIGQNISETDLAKRCEDPVCKDCTYWYMCDGGCRHIRFLEHGNDFATKRSESICAITKMWHDAIKQSLLNGVTRPPMYPTMSLRKTE